MNFTMIVDEHLNDLIILCSLCRYQTTITFQTPLKCLTG